MIGEVGDRLEEEAGGGEEGEVCLCVADLG